MQLNTSTTSNDLTTLKNNYKNTLNILNNELI